MKCNLCPRACNVDRNVNTGFCGMTNDIYAARAALHMWEEPCISGEHGSGAVFFSGCTLRCIFCQNSEIAAAQVGKKITVERLSDIFLELQDKCANNINLVTATHFVPQVAEALVKAKNNGLVIPVVYNSSAYENVSTLKILDGLVDVYLPDMKYIDSRLSAEYSKAPDYADVAKAAIQEMVRQTGKPEFFTDDDELVKSGSVEAGIMKKGVIVRHLVLPGTTKDSKAVIKYLLDTYADEIYISIMSQYTPFERLKKHPLLSRKVTRKEYDSVVDYAIECGINNGFIQEGDVAEESFIPEFDYEGI